jgi:hypothetical protein
MEQEEVFGASWLFQRAQTVRQERLGATVLPGGGDGT